MNKMIREILKIYTDNGLSNNPSFHNIEITEYIYTPARMGMPTLTATLMWEKCLDDEWTGREYVELRGQRFYIRHTPSSQKSNTDMRYKHSLDFRSEFDEILSNVYFEDYVSGDFNLTYDKPCSNSPKFTFYGTIREFSDRLNCVFLRTGVGDSILKTKTNLTTSDNPVGDGYCSMVDVLGDFDKEKSYEFSFENQTLWEAITSAYNTTEIPFERREKKIIWGAVPNVLSRTFKYGHDNELLSVSKNNANAKVVNRVTMLGSPDNIPYYYPNETEYGNIDIIFKQDNGLINDDTLKVVNRSQLLAKIQPDTYAVLGKYEDPKPAMGHSINYPYISQSMDGEWLPTYDPTQGFRILNFPSVPQSGNASVSASYIVYFKFPFRPNKSGVWELYEMKGRVWLKNESQPSDIDCSIMSGLKPEKLLKMPVNSQIWSEGEDLTIQMVKVDGVFSLGYLEQDFLNAEDLGRYDYWVFVSLDLLKIHRDFPTNSVGFYFPKTNFATFQSPLTGLERTGYYWQVGDDRYDGIGTLGVSIDNINDSMIGEGFAWTVRERMPFQERLVPPKYRNTLGAERFYNALNPPYTEPYARSHPDAYIDPDTNNPYEFPNPFTKDAPSEYIYENEDIKPTIEGVENSQGLLFGSIADIAFDSNDNDSLKAGIDAEGDKDSLNYEHSYFYIRLNKFDGIYGFNLFNHASQTDPMTIQMTSGSCNGCKFKVQVVEYEDTTGLKIPKNPVQVDASGNIASGSYDNGKTSKTDFNESQQNTQTNSIWLCVQKDIETFGVIMPNREHKYFPKVGDTFNIINIDLPDVYIYAAEKRLEEEGIRYMFDNNEEKFTFNINASRIFFAEHPEVLAELDEYSKIKVEYDGLTYELYVSSLTINCKDSQPLPEVSIELSNTIATNQSFQQRIEEKALSLIMNPTTLGMGSGGSSNSGIDLNALDKRYLRKDEAEEKFLSKTKNDRTPHKLASTTGFEVGEFISGIVGGIFFVDPDTGLTYLETDRLRVRMKAIFEELEISHTTSIGGKQTITPGGGLYISLVEELDSSYRCYFKSAEDDTKIKCMLKVGDQVICEEFNVGDKEDEKSSNRYYWRLVTEVNNEDSYIEISKTDCAEGSDTPKSGDTIVQLGNRTDKTRQSAIIHSTVDAFAPCVTLLNGIDNYSLDGKNVIEYGVDKTKNPPEPFFHCYGSFFFGPKNKQSFLEFDPSIGKLVYKGTLLIESQIQDEKGGTKTLQKYFEDITLDLNEYKYLKDATNEGTLVNGGLVLTSLIQLGFRNNSTNIWEPWSGINGKPSENAKEGYGIAAWYGGDMLDGELSKWLNPSQNRYAQTLFRFDGSGYLAGGNISWDANGAMTFGTGIHIGSGDNDTTFATLINFSNAFIPIDNNGETTWAKISTSNPLIAVKSLKGFYSDEFISVKGINDGGGQSGSSITLQYSGTGNVVTEILQSGNVLTIFKDTISAGLDTVELSKYLNTYEYATHSWVESFALANFVTLNSVQTIKGIKTFTGSYTLFSTGLITGESSSDYKRSHAIVLGVAGRNYCDFCEYGAVWNFYKHINGVDTLIAKLTETELTLNGLIKTTIPDSTSWPAAFSALCPNLGEGHRIQINFGKANTRNNVGYILHSHVEDDSNMNYISFGANGANDLMIIRYDGSVGIGTNSPNSSYKLHVNGGTYISGNAVLNGDIGIGTSSLINNAVIVRKTMIFSNISVYFSPNGDGSGKGMYFVPYGENGLALYAHNNRSWAKSCFTFSTDGVFYALAGIFSNGYISAKGQNTSSDERLKIDIKKLNIPIELIANAPSVIFKWKVDNSNDFGSIAQYWQKINPLFVRKNPQNHLSIDYGKLALCSVTEVAKETLILKQKIKDLEMELKNLKKSNS